jgi:2-polyprenyl-3-methyl-5-hydroxy-6-metoxy-1,4-benzoquinol methylase
MQPVDPTAAELGRLDQIATDSPYATGVNSAIVRYEAEVFGRHWRPGACLEIGPAEGVMTAILATEYADLTLLEGSSAFCEDLAARFPTATVVNSLVEQYEPARRFDTVLVGQVLEHVIDPVSALARVGNWLADGGVVCAAVPNARSLHREAGVLLGLLGDARDFSPADLANGHRRVYDPDSFRADLKASGLRILRLGGFWVKSLSNQQVEQACDTRELHAQMALGERYPDISALIYAICTR